MKKAVQVKKQVRLSMPKCIELVVSGVKFRLFRAAITVTIISLAAAFLMTMLSESLIGRESQIAIEAELAPLRKFLFWSGRLSSPISGGDLTDELAVAESGAKRWVEFKTWGKLSDDQLAQLSDIAQRQQTYLGYFEGLNEGIRRVLAGRKRGTEIVEHLQDQQVFEQFDKNIKQLGQMLPTSPEEFRGFLVEWDETKPLRGRILAGNADAVASVKEFLQGRPSKLLLAEVDEGFRAKLAQCGFQISQQELEVIREQARLAKDAEQIGLMVGIQTVKTRLASYRSAEIADVDKPMLFATVKSAKAAQWFIELIDELKVRLQQVRLDRLQGVRLKPEQQKVLSHGELIERFEFDLQRITEVAQRHRRQLELAEIQANLTDRSTASGLFGFSGRTKWLIVVSFVVCVVGIANAMLMSVTERFREIATMKCLGATDGFIQTNFILESIIQGIAGGIVGMLLGLLLGVLRSWTEYGTLAFGHFPVSSLLQAALLSLVVGVVVSAMAALYPARAAAKLAPMEAMRIE
ncbi:MAG: FtsX-like permease family protein [Phycisphaerae bacterium]|nr:FtsX-like permease family protein [Phycisphaerae bacterium]